MTIGVCKNRDADKTVYPKPEVAATISAATSVVQPKPMPTRIAVKISGIADGKTTKRITCQRVAPNE
jgi:hypothetical protein